MHDCYTDTNNFPLVLFYSFFTYSDDEEKKWMMIVVYKKIEKNSKKINKNQYLMKSSIKYII